MGYPMPPEDNFGPEPPPMATGAHFIGAEERPNVGASAFRREGEDEDR